MEKSASREESTASINNEDQNTQKEANISGGNGNKNDELVIEIREMVERPGIQPSKQCRIYRVPHHLRKFNEEAYTPQIISIGPFHHKNERLKAMEEYKERYFRSFVKQSKINLEYLVGTIREMEESIRGCYAEIIDLSRDRFVKMILVDASFILELFIRSVSQTSDDPMFVEPRATYLYTMLDLLLIENQLPFIVIEKLYNLAFPSLCNAYPILSKYHDLLELTYSCFIEFNIELIPVHYPNVKIVHFTDFLRSFQLPPPDKRPKRGNNKIGLSYTATQLREAGVKFERAGTRDCCFDTKFENGVLKLPSLELNDSTEVLTRNIMALEQTHYMDDGYFTDYFLLMDLLINTREDVDLLCHKNIWVNDLGDNNAATSMINNLNNGIILRSARDDYVHLCNDLNSFYENRWHKRKAILKREYFSTPWRTASTVAAIILLFLTFIQTIFSIIPVVKG